MKAACAIRQRLGDQHVAHLGDAALRRDHGRAAASDRRGASRRQSVEAFLAFGIIVGHQHGDIGIGVEPAIASSSRCEILAAAGRWEWR